MRLLCWTTRYEQSHVVHPYTSRCQSLSVHVRHDRDVERERVRAKEKKKKKIVPTYVVHVYVVPIGVQKPKVNDKFTATRLLAPTHPPSAVLLFIWLTLALIWKYGNVFVSLRWNFRLELHVTMAICVVGCCWSVHSPHTNRIGYVLFSHPIRLRIFSWYCRLHRGRRSSDRFTRQTYLFIVVASENVWPVLSVVRNLLFADGRLEIVFIYCEKNTIPTVGQNVVWRMRSASNSKRRAFVQMSKIGWGSILIVS